MSLPNPTTVTYNGVQFGTETETLGASSKFIYSADGRTVTKTVITLRIKSQVVAQAAQNATMAALRTALERPGQALVYSGTAFGGLSLNVGGGTRDLAWGPRPQLLEWKPTGRDRAAEIVWTVEVALIGCANAAFQGQVMEATYALTLQTDKGGYLTRTHAGTIVIPATRTAAGGVPDSADAYFEAWVPRQLSNFDRTISRTLNRAHDTLDFTITDTERRGNALPDGAVDATASHTYTASNRGLFLRWTGTITARYELQRDRPRSDAWEMFKALLKDRLATMKQAKPGCTFIPIGMTIGEPELYGPTCAEFSLSYLLAFGNGAKSENFFPTAGLWAPVPGANGDRWTQSLANGAQHPRGLSRYQHRPADDAIVDLCLNVGALRGNNGGAGAALRGVRIDPKYAELKRVLQIEDNPPPSNTWLGYVCQVVVEPLDRTAHHFPLPAGPLALFPILRAGVQLFPQLDPPFGLGQQVSPGPIAQPITSPGYYVRLIGWAVRYAYEVPRPRLGGVGGAPVYDANDPRLGTFWKQWQAGFSTGPIYAAAWNLRYFVARRTGDGPALLPIAPHPDMQTPNPPR